MSVKDATMLEDHNGMNKMILDKETLRDMYRWMVRVRQFDRRAVNLQRQGRIGTYAILEGQEAAQIGSAFALEGQDWIFPTYRDHGATMKHGLPLSSVLMYWNGRVEGCVPPDGVNVYPIAVPIATQLPHAVGAAWAAKLKGEDSIAIGYCGDGATSEGDFHEAMNFAGVFQVPVVLFCQNNGYAISVPFSKQTATETIVEKAAAYGIEGVRVDGNDVLAVYEVTKKAVDKARSGGGPTFIEAVTYRMGAHTTADDPTRYRPEGEFEAWQEKDPIDRFRTFLGEQGHWSQEDEELLYLEIDEELGRAVDLALNASPADPADLFNHMFAELPWNMKEQRAELLQELKQKEGRD